MDGGIIEVALASDRLGKTGIAVLQNPGDQPLICAHLTHFVEFCRQLEHQPAADVSLVLLRELADSCSGCPEMFYKAPSAEEALRACFKAQIEKWDTHAGQEFPSVHVDAYTSLYLALGTMLETKRIKGLLKTHLDNTELKGVELVLTAQNAKALNIGGIPSELLPLNLWNETKVRIATRLAVVDGFPV